MNLYISGSHGVGKTTLVQWAADQFGLQMVPEQARLLLQTKYKLADVENDFDVFKAFQRDVLDQQWCAEKEIRDRGDRYVVDRPFIDSFVYVHERYVKERANVDEYYCQYGKDVVDRMAWMGEQPYTVFFIRWSSELWETTDEYRNTSPFYAEAIDFLLESNWRSTDDAIVISTTQFEQRKTILLNSFPREARG